MKKGFQIIIRFRINQSGFELNIHHLSELQLQVNTSWETWASFCGRWQDIVTPVRFPTDA